jgi:hypothetical protein
MERNRKYPQGDSAQREPGEYPTAPQEGWVERTYAYEGDPTGISGGGYIGTTAVYGIPPDEHDLTPYLNGFNLDLSAEIGVDSGLEVEKSGGISISLSNTENGFATNKYGGFIYDTQSSIGVFGNMVPTGVDGGVQIGLSNSIVTQTYDASWWPEW